MRRTGAELGKVTAAEPDSHRRSRQFRRPRGPGCGRGEIGRRKGLKIPRLERAVPVRPRPPAPDVTLVCWRVRTMFISRLEIEGFRGIKTGVFSFQPFSVLIGPNNCGKTTITEALALVLGRDRLVRPLTEHDFYGSAPSRTDRIKIIATLTGFDPATPERHTDWFRWGRGIIRWQDAESGEIKNSKEKPTDALACQIAFAARFDHETLETVTARYFYDADVDPFLEDATVATVSIELIKQIGFFLVPANRNWDRTISFGSELFRRVVAYVGGKPAAAVLKERERLRYPESPLEEDVNLSDLVGNINDDIQKIFGKNASLKLRLTTTDSDGILESIVPHFAKLEKTPLPSRRHGSGLVSLQTLILLMRFGQVRLLRGEGFMMVIEEPELHVPPSLQRKLLRMMQSMATQTVVTTHSPSVAAIPEPNQIYSLVNTEGTALTFPLSSKPLSSGASSPVRSLLLSDRDATVLSLMHPSVLVPEGKTDAGWLKLLVKVLDLDPPLSNEAAVGFGHEVGVVPTKDARIKDVFEHLSSIHPSVFCLADGDAAGNVYENDCCTLNSPPKNFARWPSAWRIEDVIGWIVDADPSVLSDEDVVAAGLPGTREDLVEALLGPKKSDEIAHARLADAMIGKSKCRCRIAHVLRFLSDVGMGRVPEADAGSGKLHTNGFTMIWTFKHDVHRL